MTESKDDRTLIWEELEDQLYGHENIASISRVAEIVTECLGLDPDMTVDELRRRLEIAERVLRSELPEDPTLRKGGYVWAPDEDVAWDWASDFRHHLLNGLDA